MSLARKLGAFLVLLAVGVGSGPPAAAAPKKPLSYQQRMEAKRLFDQAHLAYERGRYEEAILKWEKSYELSGEPLIFESIANAYERLGDPKAARDYLGKWRAEAPKGEWSALDERLASLDARIAREIEEEAAAEDRRREQEQQQQSTQEEQERAKRERERLREQQAQARDQSELGTQLTIAGSALAGVGAAAVVVGVILDAVAASSRPDEGNACASVEGQQLCRAVMRDDIEGANSLAVAGDVTWIAGSVVAATGIALLVTAFVRSEDDASASGDEIAHHLRLAPLASPSGAGFELRGRF